MDVNFDSGESVVDELISALECVNDEATVRIHRQKGTARDEQPLLDIVRAADFTADDLTMMIRRRWGGGKFRLYFRQPGNQGNVRNVLLVFEGKEKIEEEAAPVAVRADPPLPQLTAESLGAAIAAALAQVMPAGRAAADPGEAEDRVLDRLLRYRDVLGGGGEKQNPIAQVREFIGLAKEMGVQVGPTPERDESFGDVLGQFIPVIQAAVDKSGAQQSAPVAENQSVSRDQAVAQFIFNSYSMGVAPVNFAEVLAGYGATAELAVRDEGIVARLCSIEARFKDSAAMAWLGEVVERVRAIFGLPSKFADEYAGDDGELQNNEGAG